MRPILACTILILVGCQSSADGTKPDTCAGPLGKPLSTTQIAAMPTCCQADMGHAHCLGAGSVPSDIQGEVAKCDSGGFCIPDSFLETGAAVPPKQCTAFGGMGVCLSRCIPQVSQNAALLKPDVCTDPDELCVPCVNPIDMTQTGACDLLAVARCVGDGGTGSGGSGTGPMTCDDPNTCVYEAGCPPVLDPATLPTCGTDAHCVPSNLVPADEAGKLAPCTDATQLCVPDMFIETGGKFIAKTCTSVAGAEGRCMSTVLPDVQKQASMLPQDTCAASEKCAPCYDPITGASTGACNQSCDTGPTKPAVKFASCCSAQAHCVPTTSVPTAEQGNLSQQECATANLCVPDQLLLDQPIPTCTANSFLIGNYTGVCLSDCLDFGIESVALARGSCATNYTCAPCTFGGQPTGAPGCP